MCGWIRLWSHSDARFSHMWRTATNEPSHHGAHPPPALQPTPSPILHCLLFFHFKGSGAYEIRSGLDFPTANLCPAEENIKNTQRCTSAHEQQYFLFAQIASSNPLPVRVEAPAGGGVVSGVVVESGPVMYDDVPADEEEDEEDETCVSALEMLGSNGESCHTLFKHLWVLFTKD